MNLVTICSKCEFESSELSKDELELVLLRALSSSGLDHEFTIRWSDCMNVCDEPVTMALQGTLEVS